MRFYLAIHFQGGPGGGRADELVEEHAAVRERCRAGQRLATRLSPNTSGLKRCGLHGALRTGSAVLL